MGWFIAGLLGLVFLGGLVLFIRRRRSRPSADDTLVTDLLGPPDQPAVPAPLGQRRGAPAPAAKASPPAAKAPEESEPPPAAKAPPPAAKAPGESEPPPAAKTRKKGVRRFAVQARGGGVRSPAAKAAEDSEPSPAVKAAENSELSPAAQAREGVEAAPAPPAPAEDGDWLETQLAWINAWSQRMNQQITSAEQPEPGSKE